jgi:hypothetical protein
LKNLIVPPLGACPRIGSLFKVEKFLKNKHSHIFDIGVSLRSLTCEYYFLGIPKSLGKRPFPDKLLGYDEVLLYLSTAKSDLSLDLKDGIF